MNRVNPKSLLHSKWTKVQIENKEKHFVIIQVEQDENHKVVECIIQSVMNQKEYSINWRDLKNVAFWRQGWQ